MTDISIPAGALEAGIAKLPHNVTRAELRAAFLVMIKAWPGMRDNKIVWNGDPSIILPLPKDDPSNG